ncbi:alpha/beta hydrolase family protein [Parafrankia sp. FMc2]|uniref:alpha/beta hydrolase family protein n=1 Tax=Parafrankia sp. FMc2 TaxID=3233196 RepID=UPI0034D4E72B
MSAASDAFPAARGRLLLAAAVALGALLLPSCGASSAGSDPAGRATGTAGAASAPAPGSGASGSSAAGRPVLAPDQPGEHPVGYQTLTVTDEKRPNRPLVTSVWYPARAGAGPARYPVTDGVTLTSRRAGEEAPAAPGRFPMVVMSHGSAGSRVQLAYLAEALASRGFVVAAPDHPGDTMIEVAEGRQAPLVDLASDRLLDISSVIAAFTKPDCPIAGMVRPDQIGIVGFSFGGLTSMTSTVGFLNAPADSRIRAVVGIAPATEVVPADQLARLRVPTIMIGGLMDGAVPLDRNARPAFGELTGSRPRYLVTVAGGTHNSFTEICAQAAAARDRPVAEGVRVRLEVTADMTCRPPAIDIDRAHRLTVYYTVAFLESQLAGAAGYDRYLTAAAARTFPESELHVVD